MTPGGTVTAVVDVKHVGHVVQETACAAQLTV